MKNIIYPISFILSLAVAPNLYADYGQNKGLRHYDNSHDFKHELNVTVRKQHQRITKGIDYGILTQRQVRKLEKIHNKLSRMENAFWSDHYFSRWERQLLTGQLEHFSNKIYAYRQSNQHLKNHHRNNDYRFNHDSHAHKKVSYGWENTHNHRKHRNY